MLAMHSNYRPISILTCFSKIFEKLIFSHFNNFFLKHKAIQGTQYGFQSNISTKHALLDVLTTFSNMYNNQYTSLILLDLTKASDTVSHKILFHKLDTTESVVLLTT